MILSIIIFFILTLGLGFIVDLFIKGWKADLFEKLIIRLGTGILMIPVLGFIFNTIKIPLHWISFLIVAFITFGAAIKLREKDILKFNFKKIKINYYTIGAILLFSLSAYMYISGSFAYPWFEDGDPYSYAAATNYISLEKTYSNEHYFTHFAYPYPQGYSVFMSIFHQTNDSINWTFKFFQGLIVSLSILFFYLFARKFSGKDSMALLSTFILTAIPAWLGHFIFGLGFNMALMPILFYAIFSIDDNKNWKYMIGLIYGSLILTHFYTSFVITIMLLITYVLKVLVTKELNKNLSDGILIGFGVGVLFWVPAFISNWGLVLGDASLGGMDFFYPILILLKNNVIALIALIVGLLIASYFYVKSDIWFKPLKKNLLAKKNFARYSFAGALLIFITLLYFLPQNLFYAKGSASRPYTWGDFFIAKQGNMINNPIGIGIVVMTLFIIAIAFLIWNNKKLFEKKNFYLLTAFSFAIFTYIGVRGTDLAVGFVPFRMWTFFGFSLSLITGYFLYIILNGISNSIKDKSIKFATLGLILLILVTSVHITSFKPKYWHNTAVWPEHQIMVPDSQKLFIWMMEGGIPKNSMVLPLCNYPALAHGYDMVNKPWSDQRLADKVYLENAPERYFLSSLNQTLENNYEFLKELNYEYTILGADCIAKFKVNESLLVQRIMEMQNSTKFQLVQNTQSEFLFRVI